MSSTLTRRVFVTLGTDYHSFDRLVGWADSWAAENPDSSVLVQYGSSQPPAVAEGLPFLTPDELHQQMSQADIVVAHGGPATITEARRLQHVPVCVPRDPKLGEHVDDHQQRFARFIGERGLVRLVQSEAEFTEALTSHTPLNARADQPSPQEGIPEGVTRLGEIVARLIADHRAP